MLNLFKQSLDSFKVVAISKSLNKNSSMPRAQIREDYDYQTVSQIEPAKISLVAGPLRATSSERTKQSPFKSTLTSNVQNISNNHNLPESGSHEHLYLPVNRQHSQQSPTYKR